VREGERKEKGTHPSHCFSLHQTAVAECCVSSPKPQNPHIDLKRKDLGFNFISLKNKIDGF